MGKVVIFGATGLLGGYTSYLLRDKYDFVAVGKRASDNGFFSSLGIPYYSVDISNPLAFSQLDAIQDIDAVIHYAGAMPATMVGYKPQLYIDTIITGTLNVLNFCVKKNVSRIVFSHSHADSVHLWGKTPVPSDFNKKFPLTGDHAIYSICKNTAVDMIEHFFHEYAIRRFVLRLPTIYGFHPNPFYYVDGIKKWVAYRLLIDKALNGSDLEIWGDPQRLREFVGVKDFVQLVECCLKSQLNGGVYNVGCGNPITLEKQIQTIADVFSPPQHKSKIIYCPEKNNAPEFIHDISKTRNELNYQPQCSCEDTLLYFKQMMEENPFKLLWGDYNPVI
ncbi:MAG: NAD(P)-dependent oxidoreductase [Thermoguttaceae bacterium]|nr:NAD(P)-dependent oxidoreductase [Thermoguttaceae bacterium]